MLKIVRFIRTTSKKNKEVNVRFDVYDKGTRIYYSSQIQVSPNHWNSTIGFLGNQFLDPVYRATNQSIIEVNDIITDVYNKRNPLDEINSAWLKEKVDAELLKKMSVDVLSSKPFFLEIEDYILTYPMDKLRRRTFNIILSTFKSYEKYLNVIKNRRFVITYNSINHQFLDEYLVFLQTEKEVFEKYPKIYQDRQINKVKNRCKDTAGDYLKKLRCIINYVRFSSNATYYPFQNYRIKTPKYLPPIALTNQEVKRIYDFQSSNKSLLLVRDNFLLQNCIGCRVDDFNHFKYDDILLTQDEKTGKWINSLTYVPSKTRESSAVVVNVPLNNLAREIILKYKDKSEFLIPHFSENYYRKKLKELFSLIGLDRIVAVYDKQRQEINHVELWTTANSNLSRRSLISFLYNNKCAPEMVNSLSGHVNNSVISRYLNYDMGEKLEFLDKMCPWIDEAELFDPRMNLVFKEDKPVNYQFIPFVPMQKVV